MMSLMTAVMVRLAALLVSVTCWPSATPSALGVIGVDGDGGLAHQFEDARVVAVA